MEHLITELREWIMLIQRRGFLVVWLEYKYDFRKDEEKKHKKTKTTKKTTRGLSGEETTEEVTETSEPIEKHIS